MGICACEDATEVKLRVQHVPETILVQQWKLCKNSKFSGKFYKLLFREGGSFLVWRIYMLKNKYRKENKQKKW